MKLVLEETVKEKRLTREDVEREFKKLVAALKKPESHLIATANGEYRYAVGAWVVENTRGEGYMISEIVDDSGHMEPILDIPPSNATLMVRMLQFATEVVLKQGAASRKPSEVVVDVKPLPIVRRRTA